jgi:uncharacterized protein YxjI
MSGRVVEQEYTIRRKVFTLLGAKFHIYNSAGELIGFSQQKAFKLKEDIRFYADESKSRELVCIKARSIIDFSAAYDVIQSSTGSNLGALRRKGFASMLRDEWMVLDPADQEIGKLTEDSTAMAVVRRFMPLGNLVPQTFHLMDNAGNVFADYRTHFNPFVHRMTVSVYQGCPIVPQVVLAGGVLLLAVEGRQQN